MATPSTASVSRALTKPKTNPYRNPASRGASTAQGNPPLNRKGSACWVMNDAAITTAVITNVSNQPPHADTGVFTSTTSIPSSQGFFIASSLCRLTVCRKFPDLGQCLAADIQFRRQIARVGFRFAGQPAIRAIHIVYG